MREKLRIFPFRQHIVGNVVFLAFWRHSQVQNRHGGCEEMYKNVNTVFDGFSARQWCHSTPSLSMTSISLAGIYCASTSLGRCLCKHVDMYIITISCTWWIYALSERLLVFNSRPKNETKVLDAQNPDISNLKTVNLPISHFNWREKFLKSKCCMQTLYMTVHVWLYRRYEV